MPQSSPHSPGKYTWAGLVGVPSGRAGQPPAVQRAIWASSQTPLGTANWNRPSKPVQLEPPAPKVMGSTRLSTHVRSTAKPTQQQLPQLKQRWVAWSASDLLTIPCSCLSTEDRAGTVESARISGSRNPGGTPAPVSVSVPAAAAGSSTVTKNSSPDLRPSGTTTETLDLTSGELGNCTSTESVDPEPAPGGTVSLRTTFLILPKGCVFF
mmetsp:Transcript_34393/g.77700  ORF Transcript_34393/g.77700 Transcript_34393/m.77700 type:complete len:210 (-) Transcript_34393:7-636(-)